MIPITTITIKLEKTALAMDARSILTPAVEYIKAGAAVVFELQGNLAFYLYVFQTRAKELNCKFEPLGHNKYSLVSAAATAPLPVLEGEGGES